MRQWGAVAAAAIVLAGVFVVQDRRSAALGAALQQRQRTLQQFAKENPSLPAAGELDWLTTQIQERSAAYDALVGLIDPAPTGLPDASSEEQGLYVVEQLHRVTTALRRQAGAAGTVLPEYLGFSEDLPAADQAHVRLRQVELLERVVGTFVKLGASQVLLVKPLDVKTVVAGDVRHVELPLQVSLQCSSETLVRGLHELQAVGPLVVVCEIKVTRYSDDAVDVDVVASTVMVERAASSDGA